jgi:hypothetical protein
MAPAIGLLRVFIVAIWQQIAQADKKQQLNHSVGVLLICHW